MSDQDIVAEQACITLRRGLSRSRLLAAEARDRLSELTSDSVYPGPAAIILEDASLHSDDPEQAKPLSTA